MIIKEVANDSREAEPSRPKNSRRRSHRRRSRNPKQRKVTNQTHKTRIVTEGTAFEDLPLSPHLLSAAKAMGFQQATPIQAASIPPGIDGCDVIGQAQTGSGKTAAFGLTVLHRVEEGAQAIQALIVTPTRELAVQVTDEISKLSKGRKIRLLTAVGGHHIDTQVAALRHGVDILVGTPGRLLDLMYRGLLDFGAVKIAVVDEADEMLKMGFVDDVEMILSCLPSDRQTLIFSATLPTPVLRMAEGFMRHPIHVKVKNTKETLPSLEQIYLPVKEHRRLETLKGLLERMEGGQVIVFCRTKVRVHQVGSYLKRHLDKVGLLEGDMVQGERDRTMRRFRRGQVQILVATDVVSRGIDVQNVSAVINYDCPTEVDVYVHRVGRTARAGATGAAYTFVSSNERRFIEAIERRVGKIRRLKHLSDLTDPASA